MHGPDFDIIFLPFQFTRPALSVIKSGSKTSMGFFLPGSSLSGSPDSRVLAVRAFSVSAHYHPVRGEPLQVLRFQVGQHDDTRPEHLRLRDVLPKP